MFNLCFSSEWCTFFFGIVVHSFTNVMHSVNVEYRICVYSRYLSLSAITEEHLLDLKCKRRYLTNSTSYIRFSVTERLQVENLQCTASAPEVALIVHKMSVFSVTGTALISAVYVHFHSHTLSGLLRNWKEKCLNKEFITRINIEATPDCVFILNFEKATMVEAEL